MQTWKPNFATRIATTLAVAAITAINVAPPAKATGTFEEHNRLWVAVENVGVEMFINDPEECNGMWGGGAYYQASESRRSAMLICQDNGEGVGEGNQVKWTANDLDTLRHEAHHVVQDCLEGVRADGEMERLFDDQLEFEEVITSTLSEERIDYIIKRYSERGADKETILLELEAFAVAEAVSPEKIANAVTSFCLAR